MILLKDGQYGVMTLPQSVMLFSCSTAGYSPTDDGLIALDDRVEVIDDRRIALNRLCDFSRFHPDTNYYYSYDGEQTIMVMGIPGTEPMFGYAGPFTDPVEAVTEAEEIRIERLKTADGDQSEQDSL